MHARSGNQVRAVEHGMHEFVRSRRPWRGRTGRNMRDFAVQGQQGAHVDADQLRRRHADHVGQRPIHPQNFPGLIVDHDEIGDGVENLHPVAVGLLDAGEEAGISQRRERHGRPWSRERPALPDPERGSCRRERALRRLLRSSRVGAPECNPSSPGSTRKSRPESLRQSWRLTVAVPACLLT